jgi:hypothetical protein
LLLCLSNVIINARGLYEDAQRKFLFEVIKERLVVLSRSFLSKNTFFKSYSSLWFKFITKIFIITNPHADPKCIDLAMSDVLKNS